jgi:hypothetical protein
MDKMPEDGVAFFIQLTIKAQAGKLALPQAMQIARSNIIAIANGIVQRPSPPPIGNGGRTVIELRPFEGLGVHREIGRIYNEARGVHLSLEYAYFEEGSLKLWAAGVLGGVAMATSPIVTDAYQFYDTIETTQCVSEGRAFVAAANYVRTNMTALPTAVIPANAAEAAQNAARGVRSEEVCYYQSLLGEQFPERASQLRRDGIWGPYTYQSWQDYKETLGPNVSDAQAAQHLNTAHRLRWGPLGVAIDIGAKHLWGPLGPQ